MAATAASAPNSGSPVPRYLVNSPMSRSRRALSPLTQIVGGGDSDLIQGDPAPSTSPAVAVGDAPLTVASPSILPPTENESSDNDNVVKKLAWNKPSSSSAEVGSVMGAESWPALSVSARVTSNKSSSSESLKGLLDGSSSSMPALLGARFPPSIQRQPSGDTNVDPDGRTSSSETQNVPVPKRPYRRNNTAPCNSSNIANPSPQHNAAAAPLHTLSSRDQSHNQRNDSHGGGNLPSRNSYRNRNGGFYPRGDGIQHQNYGGRRNYDHGNQTGFPHWNYNGRDVHMQPQRGLGLMRPQVLMGPPSFPANGTQLMAAPSLGPFGGPMIYPEYASAIYISHPPIGFPPQPIYYPGYDPMLFTKIANQVDFYFSADNLSKDNYLRLHMDDKGWVPISLIAGFKRLAGLTNSIQIISDAVRNSTIVEVQGESIRRRGDWSKYVWPRELRDPSVWRRQGLGAANKETVAARVQNITLSDRQEGEGQSSDAATAGEEGAEVSPPVTGSS